ncbi:MAG: hypothetical protein OEY06_09165 [Gammaproteobacteria bacterium]|nr:hypothetical protein [Gammaproteobacteria bacterium]
MKNSEDHVLDDEVAGLELVKTSDLSGVDTSLDELYALLAESSSLDNDVEVSMEDETSLSEDSILEELQAMYSGSEASVLDGVTEPAAKSVSIMDELEAMYGSSDGMIINDEKASGNEDVTVNKSVSVMEELEAMYGSAIASTTLEDLPVEKNTSSLEELEALLGDTFKTVTEEVGEDVDNLVALNDLTNSLVEMNSHEETEPSDVYSSSNYEQLFENRKSVLEELQNLLQSSVEELKTKENSNTETSILALDKEYPTRNELITLLEDKLSQLRMISDASGSFSLDGNSSVLDELNALVVGAGSAISSSNSYLPTTPVEALPDGRDISMSDNVDEYVSYINDKYKNASSDAVTESASFENLISDTNNAIESVQAQDALSVSENIEIADTDSGLKELQAYLAAMSETSTVDNDSLVDVDVDADRQVSVSHPGDSSTESADSGLSALEQFEELMGETAPSDTDVDSSIDEEIEDLGKQAGIADISMKSDSELSALEQLERLVGETTSSENKESSEDISVTNNDFEILQESSYLSDKVEEVEVETEQDSVEMDSSGQKENIQPVDAHRNRLKQRSIPNDVYPSEAIETKKHLPIGSILLVAIIVGVIILWAQFNSGEVPRDRVQPDPVASKEKAVLVESVPKTEPENNSTLELLPEPQKEALLVPETEYLYEDDSTSDMPAVVENISDSQSAIDTSIYEEESLNELNATPVDSYVDETFINNEINIDDEASASQLELPVQLMTPVEPEIVTGEASNMSTDVTADMNNVWSVHLFSYYNEPPIASEVEFLKVLGVPYKIKRAIVHGKLWYRVQVDKRSEFHVAKEYAVMLGKKYGIKGIWISKNKDQ